MQLSNKDISQKIVELFETKSRHNNAHGDTYNSVENIVKNDTVVRRHVDAFDIYKEYLKDKTRILD